MTSERNNAFWSSLELKLSTFERRWYSDVIDKEDKVGFKYVFVFV